MKKVKLSLSLCVGACLGFNSLYAQQRSVDLELVYDSLQAVDTLTVGTPIPYSATLINHGPDALVTGDTMFLNLADNSNTVFMMPSALAPGDSISIFDLTLNYQGDTTATFNICTVLYDDPNSQIQIGGHSASVSYTDPNPANNTVCSQMTMLAGVTTAVNSIDNAGSGFKLYPNPYSNGKITIANDSGKAIKEVRIIDIMGRAVFTLTGDNRSTQSFLLPDYVPVGIYSLYVLTEKGEQVLRLQVIR